LFVLWFQQLPFARPTNPRRPLFFDLVGNWRALFPCRAPSSGFASASLSEFQTLNVMPREHIILECTEARAEGKPVSRYMSCRDKKKQQGRLEKKKYNPHLRRHTLHKEIK